MSSFKKFVAVLSTVAMLSPAAGKLSADDYYNYQGSCEECYTDCRCAPSIGPVVAVGAIVVGLIVGLVVTQDCKHSH